MAEVVATQKAQRSGLGHIFQFSSAGTQASKGVGQPDSRARQALEKRGYKVPKGRSRRVDPKDFEQFDLVLAMDRSHLQTLQRLCPTEHQHKLKLFLELPKGGVADDVPDPYYGNAEGFERVLDLCERGVDDWLFRLTSLR